MQPRVGDQPGAGRNMRDLELGQRVEESCGLLLLSRAWLVATCRRVLCVLRLVVLDLYIILPPSSTPVVKYMIVSSVAFFGDT